MVQNAIEILHLVESPKLALQDDILLIVIFGFFGGIFMSRSLARKLLNKSDSTLSFNLAAP